MPPAVSPASTEQSSPSEQSSHLGPARTPSPPPARLYVGDAAREKWEHKAFVAAGGFERRIPEDEFQRLFIDTRPNPRIIVADEGTPLGLLNDVRGSPNEPVYDEATDTTAKRNGPFIFTSARDIIAELSIHRYHLLTMLTYTSSAHASAHVLSAHTLTLARAFAYPPVLGRASYWHALTLAATTSSQSTRSIGPIRLALRTALHAKGRYREGRLAEKWLMIITLAEIAEGDCWGEPAWHVKPVHLRWGDLVELEGVLRIGAESVEKNGWDRSDTGRRMRKVFPVFWLKSRAGDDCEERDTEKADSENGEERHECEIEPCMSALEKWS